MEIKKLGVLGYGLMGSGRCLELRDGSLKAHSNRLLSL